jgi:hypothetical protein
MFLGFFGLPFLLIVGLTLLVLAGKNEPDERRERPAALYLSFMTLIGVLLLLTATFLTVNGLVELTDTTPTSRFISTSDDVTIRVGPRGRIVEPPSFSSDVNHDDDVSQVIGGLIVGAIALALLRFHRPKLQDLADNSTGPGARVHSRLLYIVCGATLLTALAAAGSAVYGVYGMVAPDTAGAGEVTDALRALITAAAVAAVAALLFRAAWDNAEDLAAIGRPTEGFVAAPAETVIVEEPVVAKKAARPRKAAPPKE